MRNFLCTTSATSGTILNPLHGKLEITHIYVFSPVYINRRISGAGPASGAKPRPTIPLNAYADARVARAFSFRRASSCFSGPVAHLHPKPKECRS